MNTRAILAMLALFTPGCGGVETDAPVQHLQVCVGKLDPGTWVCDETRTSGPEELCDNSPSDPFVAATMLKVRTFDEGSCDKVQEYSEETCEDMQQVTCAWEPGEECGVTGTTRTESLYYVDSTDIRGTLQIRAEFASGFAFDCTFDTHCWRIGD